MPSLRDSSNLHFCIELIARGAAERSNPGPQWSQSVHFVLRKLFLPSDPRIPPPRTYVEETWPGGFLYYPISPGGIEVTPLYLFGTYGI